MTIKATPDNIQSVVNLLNEMLTIDPDSTKTLFKTRVGPITNELADHPTIQVRVEEDKTLSVGIIGILNGLFADDPSNPSPAQYRIAMVTDSETNELLQFSVADFSQ